ncbi:MAG: SHOCT domain-containing protein [Candidatus Limnocylindrales bacterium]
MTFTDLLWGMFYFFFWFMAIWIFITILADIIRRHDLSGGWKAVWVLVIFILPFFGCLIYLISRPAMPADQVEAAHMAAVQQGMVGYSPADEIEKLTKLKASGDITQAEFDTLKAKALASA